MGQGRTWRCHLDAAKAGDYEALRAAGQACVYVKKLALRRQDRTIEAFFGLSGGKSAAQLGRDVWANARWERVADETRHGEKWRAVVDHRSFDVVLPPDDALLRYGLQPSLHTSDAWISKHVPGLKDLHVGSLVVSADGLSAERQIHASVAATDPRKRSVARKVALKYRTRPEHGESEDAARQRMQANRDAEEKALLSFDSEAAAAARAHDAAIEKAGAARAYAVAMAPEYERKRQLGLLMVDAGLAQPRASGVRLYDPAEPVETSPFLESARYADLLMVDLSEKCWLVLLQRSLQAYVAWYEHHMQHGLGALWMLAVCGAADVAVPLELYGPRRGDAATVHLLGYPSRSAYDRAWRTPLQIQMEAEYDTRGRGLGLTLDGGHESVKITQRLYSMEKELRELNVLLMDSERLGAAEVADLIGALRLVERILGQTAGEATTMLSERFSSRRDEERDAFIKRETMCNDAMLSPSDAEALAQACERRLTTMGSDVARWLAMIRRGEAMERHCAS